MLLIHFCCRQFLRPNIFLLNLCEERPFFLLLGLFGRGEEGSHWVEGEKMTGRIKEFFIKRKSLIFPLLRQSRQFAEISRDIFSTSRRLETPSSFPLLAFVLTARGVLFPSGEKLWKKAAEWRKVVKKSSVLAVKFFLLLPENHFSPIQKPSLLFFYVLPPPTLISHIKSIFESIAFFYLLLFMPSACHPWLLT